MGPSHGSWWCTTRWPSSAHRLTFYSGVTGASQPRHEAQPFQKRELLHWSAGAPALPCLRGSRWSSLAPLS